MWNANAKNCYQEWTVQYLMLMHNAFSVWDENPANDKGIRGLIQYKDEILPI